MKTFEYLLQSRNNEKPEDQREQLTQRCPTRVLQGNYPEIFIHKVNNTGKVMLDVGVKDFQDLDFSQKCSVGAPLSALCGVKV